MQKKSKILEEVEKMSDEEIIQLEKKLYIRSGLISGGGFLLFILCVIAFIVILPYL